MSELLHVAVAFGPITDRFERFTINPPALLGGVLTGGTSVGQLSTGPILTSLASAMSTMVALLPFLPGRAAADLTLWRRAPRMAVPF